ncbi:ornithine cyclodeaminase family protein [Lactococcus taiwanensis]|uniref:Ornithine cyclodeaminase family protein n=1 Tax=Lactococcus taiwanensis TaxID=1151742 RepID=A0AA45QRW1_9LACT|nr:ornithine cyclodeaminase family protein [Lactococcus taiwanensis]QSE77384.1 ornithine cyclodeaminase family protein [Lactococcus taiwanensis]
MEIINYNRVLENLSFKEALLVMKKCFLDYSNKAITQTARTVMELPDGKNKNIFALMPAYLGEKRFFGAKILTAFPDNHNKNIPSHVGEIILFDSENGQPVAIVDANAITWIRTAAVTALATNYLARKDAHNLTLIGSGQQAASHLEAILGIRPIQTVKVFDLKQESGRTFINKMKNLHPDLSFINCQTLEEATNNTDIICTLTSSKEAFLGKDIVEEGTHINAIGTFTPDTREIKSDLMAQSKIYVDDYEMAFKESGDIIIPISEGNLYPDSIVGSLSELVLHDEYIRRNEKDITLFDAVGLAIEDLCCAEYLYNKLTKGKDIQ